MTLGEKQEQFAYMLTQLLMYIHGCGYQVRIGHIYRCADCKTGKPNSLHKLKLAADLNLFSGGKYLTSTADHLQFGQFWESIGGSWGGRFGDGNHYSLEHNGLL